MTGRGAPCLLERAAVQVSADRRVVRADRSQRVRVRHGASLVLCACGARRVRVEAPREPRVRLGPRGVGSGVGVVIGAGMSAGTGRGRGRAGEIGELDAPRDGVVREDELELFYFVEELEGR